MNKYVAYTLIILAVVAISYFALSSYDKNLGKTATGSTTGLS